MTTYALEVLGTPMPQGSKKAFAVHGRAMVKESNTLGHARWRNAVADKAREAASIVGRLDGPLRVDITYRFPMPKSRGARALARKIGWKITAPDRDKLDRAVNDGLVAGGLIRDDALICDGRSIKIEVVDGWTGALITITKIDTEAEVAA